MICLNENDKRPLYEQLYSEIKNRIVSGTMQKNKELSSLRVMEKELNVSRNTVDRAYQQLLAEGYIRSVPGAGYFVEDIENDYFNDAAPFKKSSELMVLQSDKTKLRYDFEYASIDSDLFPWPKWRKYIQNAILTESGGRAISYENNKGNLMLRKSLCGFLNRHRGVNCRPDQIVLCAGTQYAMDILTNLLPTDKNRDMMQCDLSLRIKATALLQFRLWIMGWMSTCYPKPIVICCIRHLHINFRQELLHRLPIVIKY
jgi:GntR family transcriptional regulator / MocR family aminotransferase